jgi:hypothetical protein
MKIVETREYFGPDEIMIASVCDDGLVVLSAKKLGDQGMVFLLGALPAAELRELADLADTVRKPSEREVGCLKQRAAHVQHKWVLANAHQAELWQCAHSPECKGHVLMVCNESWCGLGYCSDHMLHAPQVSRKLALPFFMDKSEVVSCIPEKGPPHEHTWIGASELHEQICHCTKSPDCKSPVVAMCEDLMCLAGRCADHAPRMKRKGKKP